MRRRVMHLLLGLALLTGLFGGALSVGQGAGHDEFSDFPGPIFFPVVHDGAEIDGQGTWYSNITVQNIENVRVFVEFSSYTGGTVHNTVALQPRASATFPAAAVNGGVTTGPVVATAYWFPQDLESEFLPCDVASDEGVQFHDGELTVIRGAGAADTVFLPEGQSDPTNVNVPGYIAGLDYQASTTADSISIDWSIGGDEPTEGAGYTVEYSYIADVVEAADCARAPHIAGYAKQASPQMMTGQSTTSNAHLSVDGFTALPVSDVAWGPQTEFSNLGFKLLGIPIGAFIGLNWDGHSYIPIVQNNNGWNTIVNLSHIDGSPGANNTTVTIRFYEAFGPGEGAVNPPGTTVMLSPGETGRVNLSDLVPEGFVGSAWITAQYGVVTVAERVKHQTDMLIVTEAAPSLFDLTIERGPEDPPAFIGPGFPESYEAYAPLIFSGHNGWNSGISVTNIAEIENTVNVQIFNEAGNTVLADTLTIPAKGQKYIYAPHVANLGLAGPNAIGAAYFSSLLPFHAAVDQVKYDGPGQDAGQAMSYIATQSGAQSIFEAPAGSPDSWARLAFPLVQKGVPATGLGDTSGLQFFNGTSDFALGGGGDLQFRVFFFDAAGNFAPPTSASGIGAPMTLGTMEGATVYTMNISQMSSGIPVSATAIVSGGLGVLYGVTNNVNYAVNGDGSVAWNAVNAWGQFRTWSGHLQRAAATLTLSHVDPNNIIGQTHTVTAELLDQFGDPISGETIEIVANHQQGAASIVETAVTDDNGIATFQYSRTTGEEIGFDIISGSHPGSGLQAENTLTKFWDAFIELAHDPEDADTNEVGTEHTVVATVTDVNLLPLENAVVQFAVEAGSANEGAVGTTDPDRPGDNTGQTDAAGEVRFTYQDTNAADGETDTISATLVAAGITDSVVKTWEEPAVSSILLTAGAPYNHVNAASWDGIDLTATVLDQFGQEMDGIDVTFTRTDVIQSLDPNNAGVFYDNGDQAGGATTGDSIAPPDIDPTNDPDGQAFATYVSDRTFDGRPLTVEITATAEGESSDPLNISFTPWTNILEIENWFGAGANGYFQASGAAFGPTPGVFPTGVSGTLQLVDDGTADPTLGCDALVGFIAGNIAVFDRGDCDFVVKAQNAQAAGAVAMIVVNNVAGAPITMGGTDPAITIPSGMISLDDGNAIKAALSVDGAFHESP